MHKLTIIFKGFFHGRGKKIFFRGMGPLVATVDLIS